MDPIIVSGLSFGCVVLGFVCGAAYGYGHAREDWQKTLVARYLAYYDPKTGEFKFKEKGQ
jgi:hypothetical protein